MPAEEVTVTVPPELAALCREEHPRLVRMLDLYLGDLHVAEELAQEALLRAAERWEHVGQLQSPGGWTRRVAINLANSWYRRRAAARRARRRLGPVDDRHHDPDAAEAVAVREAVAALPERQRLAVVLRHLDDLDVREVAAAMGISDDAVRSLTKRGVARLRAVLDHDPSIEEDARA